MILMVRKLLRPSSVEMLCRKSQRIIICGLHRKSREKRRGRSRGRLRTVPRRLQICRTRNAKRYVSRQELRYSKHFHDKLDGTPDSNDRGTPVELEMAAELWRILSGFGGRGERVENKC
jgi:hypothetical protein